MKERPLWFYPVGPPKIYIRKVPAIQITQRLNVSSLWGSDMFFSLKCLKKENETFKKQGHLFLELKDWERLKPPQKMSENSKPFVHCAPSWVYCMFATLSCCLCTVGVGTGMWCCHHVAECTLQLSENLSLEQSFPR